MLEFHYFAEVCKITLFSRIHEFLRILYHFGLFLKDEPFEETFSVEILFTFRLFDLLSC